MGTMPKSICAEDQLIVAMRKGELLNKAKAPPAASPLARGPSFLLPKKEACVLRNAGKQEVDVLLICLSPIGTASR